MLSPCVLCGQRWCLIDFNSAFNSETTTNNTTNPSATAHGGKWRLNYQMLVEKHTADTDGDGTSYTLTYDSFGRSSATYVGSASSGTRLAQYTYNEEGLLDKLTYGNGQYVNYSYDPLGRQTKVWYNGNTASTVETVYNNFRGITNAIVENVGDHMEKRKMLFLARFIECQIEAEINNVLRDSIDDPHFSAVYTASLICLCSELLAELDDEPLPYRTVEEYFAYLGCSRQEYELFEEKRRNEAKYYIGEQYEMQATQKADSSTLPK